MKKHLTTALTALSIFILSLIWQINRDPKNIITPQELSFNNYIKNLEEQRKLGLELANLPSISVTILDKSGKIVSHMVFAANSILSENTKDNSYNLERVFRLLSLAKEARIFSEFSHPTNDKNTLINFKIRSTTNNFENTIPFFAAKDNLKLSLLIKLVEEFNKS
ncbi:MAG TPA: hypothetical protein PKD37_08140 [Oligoflexia bacterium]|nr:hypothetical protein [Oligoflexia bacterium]HMP27933.1 hypothetical protein [Oligoflexia bacterium]